jgi:hypothetical protein
MGRACDRRALAGDGSTLIGHYGVAGRLDLGYRPSLRRDRVSALGVKTIAGAGRPEGE